ncbi:MAG: ABC transporter ATP-binding protein [Oceanicoccus sp.]|uniref:ABC transporter ATP-binding protein n=1 Tax=Oceanicoccus sp. TaxID=2691044 RepID=UPI00261E3D4B|nr:ABC transporter ATP-binding protein [Oceanicoccus sp.]MCP3908294.1 ABC transporter ATP-binding protein [Oceanicoccus sp.]
MQNAIALQIEHLSKTYDNRHRALGDVNLSVEGGDFFALLGPNGAGKSTLIGIVTSLVNKTAGKVFVHGLDMDVDAYLAKAQIGLVPQEFNFNHWETPLDILVTQAGYYGITRRVALQKAEYYLQKLDLWDKHHEPSRMLSGGMKRRLMIARALVHEPRLLILDEPTAGVDVEIRHSMWGFLRELNKAGTTIILTTHYLEEAEQLCRRIAIIDNGEIIEQTDMRTLLARLQTETYVLDLEQDLQTLPDIKGYRLTWVDARTLDAVVSKDEGINPLFEALSRQQVRVLSMRNKSNRLEQLFIRMIEENELKEARTLPNQKIENYEQDARRPR